MTTCPHLLFLLLNLAGNRGLAGRVGEKGYHDKKAPRTTTKMAGNVK